MNEGGMDGVAPPTKISDGQNLDSQSDVLDSNPTVQVESDVEKSLDKKPRPDGYFPPSLTDALSTDFDPSERYAKALEESNDTSFNEAFPITTYQEQTDRDYLSGLTLINYSESINEITPIVNREALDALKPVILAQAKRHAEQLILEKRNTEKNYIDAREDPLTKLPNRRALFERMKKQQEENIPWGLLVIDIDHFKKTNDQFGHPAGDQLLVQVANEIQKITRQNRVSMPNGVSESRNGPETDLAVRFGGEEFVVLVSGATTDEDLKAAGERIVNAISTNDFLIDENSATRITVSVGGALPGTDITKDSSVTVLEEADRNLYTAKKNGRNRYVGANEHDSIEEPINNA